MTDIFAPVSNSAIVGHSWTVTWWVALIPCMDTLLIAIVAYAPSKFKLGCNKSKYYSNRFFALLH